MADDPHAEHPPEKPTPTSEGNNISTDHQRAGDAKLPSDTLGREKGAGEDDGGRASSFLHPGGEAPGT